MPANYWNRLLDSRLTRRRALASTGAAGLGAALLAACGSSSNSSSSGTNSGGAKPAGLVIKPEDTSKQAKRGGTMKTYWDADISDYDVHNTRNAGQNIPNLTFSR